MRAANKLEIDKEKYQVHSWMQLRMYLIALSLFSAL
jgi:hypothetical protein